jgi:metallo-beta-lactamase class B
MHKVLSLILVLLSLCPALVMSQPAGWNDPFPPHKIMENFYFVGTSQLASFLITTDEGNILVNSSYESSVPVIKASVESLGFDFNDTKILISGHSHADHIEGDALVREMTGAQVVVGRLEVPAVTALTLPSGRTPPVDRIVDDGEVVTLGGISMTAHLMPGHTPGCLTWTFELEENGTTYKVLIEGSINSQIMQFVSLEEYPGIVDDLRSTYAKARAIPAEVWVSSHGMFYGLEEKYPRLTNSTTGSANPFYDPAGYQKHVDEFEAAFEPALQQQPDSE